MSIGDLILYLLVWNIIGIWIYGFFINHDSHGRPYLNPVVIYENIKVNYFGCAILTILVNLLCPILSIIYWMYKFIYFICAVGRDKR